MANLTNWWSINRPVSLAHRYRIAGTMEGWRREVASPASGNSRLLLTISAGFATPMLALLEMEGGGFNLHGRSSIGKTTLLRAAGSVWGGGGMAGFVRRWRTTDNGLEGTALTHCDALLLLDELAQIDSRAAGQTAYMLANGQGKMRANRQGLSGMAAPEWRTLFLSSGEIRLADKLAEDRRRKMMAVQEVRIVDLEAEAAAALGVFETLHGFKGPADFADALQQAADRHYGHASRVFLAALVTDIEGARTFVRDQINIFLRDHCPEQGDGQIRRVAKRFALFGASGELATDMGEAKIAAGRCFAD